MTFFQVEYETTGQIPQNKQDITHVGKRCSTCGITCPSITCPRGKGGFPSPLPGGVKWGGGAWLVLPENINARLSCSNETIEFFTLGLSDVFLSDYLTVQKLHSTK